MQPFDKLRANGLLKNYHLTRIAGPIVAILTCRQLAAPFFAGALIRSLRVTIAVDRRRVGAVATIHVGSGVTIESFSLQTIRAMFGIFFRLGQRNTRKENQREDK